jgi:transketolase
MINKKLFLSKNIFKKNIEYTPTRNGFGEGMAILGEKNKKVMALCADLTGSTRIKKFADAFPDRFIEIGVAEQNLMGVAAGLALSDKIPYVASYAVFSPGRNWDQLRVSVCYNNLNVKIVGAHAGVSVGPDGATHQALEDIAITRVLPNLTVIVPCDFHETKKAAIAAARHKGPVYIRFAREETPIFTTDKTPFKIGKAEILYDGGDDLCLVGSGPLLYECLLAAKQLKKDKIKVKVVNLHTVKPLDRTLLLKMAKNTKAFVVVEEHQKNGGVFGAVSEFITSSYPIPMEAVAVNDRFGESGKPYELLEHFNLMSPDIVKASKKVYKRKNK